MKPTFLTSGLVVLILFGAFNGSSEEAHTSVYVVDHGSDFTETGGACLPYSSVESTGPSREILGIAKGPPGSTLFMIAFDRDAPHLNLAPVIAEQTADSKPARFPAEGSVWPFETPGATVDLYVAVFDKSDPELAKLTEYGEWLTEALAKKEEVEALLHAEVILKRLSNLLRQRNVEEYRVNFGEGLTSLRLPPASKAAISRGATNPIVNPAPREPKSSVGAVRRGLKTLDEEWREDSRVIPFGLGTPGVLVFPITTPPKP